MKKKGPESYRSRKKIIFSLLVLIAMLFFLEVSSFIIYLVTYGGNDFSTLRKQKNTLIYLTNTDSPKNTTKRFDRQFIKRKFLQKKATHPYIGFASNPSNSNKDFKGYGFPKTIYKKSSDHIIILILGGSVAGGFNRYGSKHLIKELKFYNYTERKIVVLNLAVGGYKQPQQLMALNYYLAIGGEFDIVINIDGFNDITLHSKKNELKGVSIFYPTDWFLRSQGISNPVVAYRKGKLIDLRIKRMEIAKSYSGINHYSFTLNLLWKVLDSSLQSEYQKNIDFLNSYVPKGNLPYSVSGPKLTYANEEEIESELVDLWKRCSLIIKRICDSHNGQYFHFLQPNQYFLNSKDFNTEERKIAYLESHPFNRSVNRRYPLLQQKSQELIDQSVNFEDLTMVFKYIKKTTYIDNCCHLNEFGNQIMAKKIANTILQHK
ncbi:hypothetical protein [Candidatus Uabimicrobium sp. HlEnr_7]|uniref:hypothetical protein n=1 Tax=Candidatus Uabimicrobium helgolandensis TaxID=3095367 RepID=UPI0035569768